MTTFPNTKRARIQERKYIFSTAQHNGFPTQKIIAIEKKEIDKDRDKRSKTNKAQEKQIEKKK